MFTAYSLTHSNDLFKAAALTDGVDAGWYQYLTYGSNESVRDNGGEVTRRSRSTASPAMQPATHWMRLSKSTPGILVLAGTRSNKI